MIKHARRELRKMTCDLDHIDATIRLFDPDADIRLVKPYPTKHRAHKGERTGFVLNYLRKAEGPVTSLEITKAMIAERGLKADDGTVVMLRKRIGACLTKLKGDGVVEATTMVGEYKGWIFTQDE